MAKKKLTLTVNEDLIEWAKNYGINISQFLENQLSETRRKLKKNSKPSLGNAQNNSEMYDFSFAGVAELGQRRETQELKPRKQVSKVVSNKIAKEEISKFIKKLKVSGTSGGWAKRVGRQVERYIEGINGEMSFPNTLDYLSKLKEKYKKSTYRHHVVSIKQFLKYKDIDFVDKIDTPDNPPGESINLRTKDIKKYLQKVMGLDKVGEVVKQRFKTAHILSATSGMRPGEVYSLDKNHLNLGEGYISIEEDKNNYNRYAVFNGEATKALKDWLDAKPNGENLFNKRGIRYIWEKYGEELELRMKHMRKFFSQEWDRNQGPTTVKKLLMGHSKSTDLKHYDSLGLDDLRNIYEKVGVEVGI